MATVRVRLAPLLYSYTGGRKIIEVDGATVGEAIAEIDRLFPGVAFRVIDEQQRIRPHVNIFLGEQNVRDLATPVAPGNDIFIVGALSGGSVDKTNAKESSMKLKDYLLPEIEREIDRSKRALEQVPAGKYDWKPHEKSMLFGYLVNMVATIPTWILCRSSRRYGASAVRSAFQGTE